MDCIHHNAVVLMFCTVSIDETDASSQIRRRQLIKILVVSEQYVTAHQIDFVLIAEIKENMGLDRDEIKKNQHAHRSRRNGRQRPQMFWLQPVHHIIYANRTHDCWNCDTLESHCKKKPTHSKTKNLNLPIFFFVDKIVNGTNTPAIDHIMQFHRTHCTTSVVCECDEQTDVLRDKSPDARPSCDLQSHKAVCDCHTHDRQRQCMLTKQINRTRHKQQICHHIDDILGAANNKRQVLKFRDPDTH